MQTTNFQDEFQGADAGLARELLSLRQMPGAALQRRVGSIPQQKARQQMIVPRLAWAAVVLALAAALLFTSPAVRAALGEVEEVIGQVYLMVMDALPDNSEGALIEGEWMSLEEARAAVPFDFAIPTYAPDGFIAPEEVEVYIPDQVGEVVQMEWRDAEGHLLELSVHVYNEAEPIHTIVGPDSSETVLVNGQEAAVVRGGWDNPSGEWRYQDQTMTLIWELDGVQYGLLSHGDAVPVEELIIMAESVR